MGLFDKDGGKSTEFQTQTVSSEPPSFQKPFLEKGFKEAERLYDSDLPGYYPDSTVVGFSPQSELALRLTEERALNGSPLTEQAQNTISDFATGQHVGSSLASSYFTNSLNFQNAALPTAQNNSNRLTTASNPAINQLQDTASGAFLSANNPYLQNSISFALQPAIDQFNQQIAPGIDSAFAKSGRLGSNAYATARNSAEDTLARNLTGVASQVGLQNYGDERQRQLAAQSQIGTFSNQDEANRLAAQQALASVSSSQQGQQLAGAGALSSDLAQDRSFQYNAATAAPSLAASDYYDPAQLANVGAAREGLAQSQLQDNINRFNFEQQKPFNKLGTFLSQVNGGYGSNETSVSPVHTNPAANFLSAALGGAGLGNVAGFDPLYGAVGGGLLGLL